MVYERNLTQEFNRKGWIDIRNILTDLHSLWPECHSLYSVVSAQRLVQRKGSKMSAITLGTQPARTLVRILRPGAPCKFDLLLVMLCQGFGIHA